MATDWSKNTFVLIKRTFHVNRYGRNVIHIYYLLSLAKYL